MAYLKDLASTSVFYWRQPEVKFSQVAVLLTSNGMLLILCKSASFGFDDLSVAFITAFIALLYQHIASIVSLLRKGNEGIQIEAPKLAKVMAIIWLVSLTLFLPNSIPRTRWFGVIDSLFVIALVHSLVATGIITYYSLRQLRLTGIKNNEFFKTKRKAYLWAPFFVLVNTVFFQLFVLDPDTHYWILDNYKALKAIIQ